MDFGMPTLLEYSSLRENLELCAKLRLAFVELNMNLPYCQLSELARHDMLRAFAAKYGIYFTIHADENLDPFCFNSFVSDAWLQTALAAADSALAIGAPIINIHLVRGIYFTLPDRREFLYQSRIDDYLRSVVRFRDALDQKLNGSDILVCIENTDGFTDFQLKAIEVMLQSSHFALTWDIGHSCCADEQDMPFILSNSSRLRHMHIHDADCSHCHLPFGTGELPLAQRLNTAAENNCRCVIEVKTSEALSDSVEYLRSSLL